jgi:hypothetical protein
MLIVANKHNMKTTHVSVVGWTGKETVTGLPNIIQPLKWKKSVICNKMDESGGHYAKWNKLDVEWQILHELTYNMKSNKSNLLKQ